jgi:Uncharacterized protein conserved in bacteria
VKNLNPYLNLSGRCREALDFYKASLGGEVVTLMTFADAKTATPPGLEHNVMHSEFRSEGVHLMASDGMPGHPTTTGDNISLALGFDDPAEQTRVFDALAQGGEVTLPLHDAFWGDRFGMLIDRFGIHWLFNCPKS